MDNGKIKIYLKEDIPVMEIYHDGEINIADAEWVHHTLHHGFTPPLKLPMNLIIDRVGSYSIDEEVYMALHEYMLSKNRVAFVVHRKQQKVVIGLAANTYMSTNEVKYFSSIDDAHSWLSDTVMSQVG